MLELTPEVAAKPRGMSRVFRRAAVLVATSVMVVLSTGSAARAAYDPQAAATFLTPIGPVFPTGSATSAVAFSPDGELVVTADRASDTITLAHVTPEGGIDDELGTTYLVGDGPAAIAFSPDGRVLAVANEFDSTLSMFFVSIDQFGVVSLTPTGPAQAVGAGPVSLAFSPNSRYLATADRGDRGAKLYSVGDGGALTLAAAPLSFPLDGGDVKTVRFSSRGVLVVGVDFPQKSYYFYQLGSNGSLAPSGLLRPLDATLCDAQFSPDGTKFAYSNCYRDYDSVSILAITPEGRPSIQLARFFFYPTAVAALAWSPDGSLLATANFNGPFNANGPGPGPIPGNTISMFSVTDDGAEMVGDATPTSPWPSALTFGRDGRLLAVVGEEGTSTYRVSAHGRLAPIGAPANNPGGDVRHVAFSADGSLFATATAVFAVSSNGALRLVSEGDASAARSADVAFSPAGDLLARADSGANTVSLESVSASTGIIRAIGLPKDVQSPRKIAFSMDGTLLAVLDATGVSTFRVNVDTGLELVDRRTWSGANPRDIAFQPGGTVLTIADEQARLVTISVTPSGTLSLARFTPVPASPDGTPRLGHVAFNADGTVLAAADQDDSRIWLFAVAADGEPTSLGATTLGTSLYSIAFVPTSDDVLVVGTYLGVGVYEVDDERLHRLAAPSGAAGADEVAISPNGKWVAAASNGIGMWSLTAPWLEVSTTAGPAPLTQSSDADIAFSAEYPTRFECRVDGGAYRPCSSPWSVSALEDGAHVASIRARDLSGAIQGEPATWRWKSDVHGPATPAQTAPSADAVNLPPSQRRFSWKATTDAASAVDRYELWIDQSKVAELGAATCLTACEVVNTTALAEGAHSWTVRVYDALGHLTTTAERSFSVDATPPSAPGLAGPDDGAFLGDSRPRLAWSASHDPGAGLAGYDVLVDGQSAAVGLPATETGWIPPSGLTEGAHTWQVVAKDGVGNTVASARRTMNIDQTAPAAVLRVSPSRFVPPFKVTLDASASNDPGGSIARYEFDLDGNGSYETISTSPRVETTFTTLGQHPVGVRVVDRVGHSAVAADTAVGEAVTGQDSHEASVTIDDGAEYTRSRTVTLTLQPPPRSGAVTMILSNDGRPDQALRRPLAQRVNSWALAKGDGLRDRRIVYVVFYNSAGLQVTNGRVQDDILYDPYPPTVTDARLRVTGRHAATLSFRAKDRGSGLSRWELVAGKRVLARRSRFKGAQKITLTKRVGKVSLVLRDKAGNTTRAAVKVRRGH